MGFSKDLLNSIRYEQDSEYQARIPEASKDNFRSIGQAFENYAMEFNKFQTAFIHKVGLTKLSDKMYKNRLARFKQGAATPHDIEEIFTEWAKAEGVFDPTGPNPMGRREGPASYVIYHRENRQDYYAISLSDIDFRKAFLSEATLDAYLAGKLNAVYSADERDEYLCMKNLLATYSNGETPMATPAEATCGYFLYETPEFDKTDPTAWAKHFTKTIRKSVFDLTLEPSKKFNAAGVETISDASGLVLFVNSDILVESDVELLMNAYNKDKGDLSVVPDIVPMKDFGTLPNTDAILVDKDWFRVYDTLFRMATAPENAQGLFTNHFLHHHQILSASKFKNAVRFGREIV